MMKRARKVSNVQGEVYLKQNKGQTLPLLEIHSPTENSPVKAQKISSLAKLHAINMQLYQN